MIDSNVHRPTFLAKISKATEEDDYEADGADNWIFGEQARNKEGIHTNLDPPI
jgi:hypothetical protein